MKNYYLVAAVSNYDIVRFIIKVNNFKNLEKKIRKIMESNVIIYKEDCKCSVSIVTDEKYLEFGNWEYSGLITTDEISIDRNRQRRCYRQYFSTYVIKTKSNKNLPPILTYKNSLIGRQKSGKILDPLAETLLLYNDINIDIDSKIEVYKYKVKIELISTGTKL